MPGLAHILDPLPLLGVLLGALLVAALQLGRTAIGPAFAALPRLLRADPDADRDFARAAVNAVDRVAELQGLPRTDRVGQRPGFLSDAVHRLADCQDLDRFAQWAHQAITDRTDRHGRVVAFWDAVADAAPAMGMAGTIIGLVGMFASMDDPAALGPAMAIALLATFHGLVTANMIVGPVARRLERLSHQEIAWQEELADRLIAIGRREAIAAASPPAPSHRHMRRHSVREAA